MTQGAVESHFGWGWVSLLPCAPYSIRHESRSFVLGLAFERQQGVHAVGDARRHDFDAWPGELALTGPDVELFSESRTGGEYLALHLKRDWSGLEPQLPPGLPRSVFRGDRQAVRLGERLRRSLLASQPWPPLIEEQAMAFLDRGVSLLAAPRREHGRRDDLDRQAHSRALQYIDDAIDGPLSLDQMARVAGMPVLRFLRSFSSAVGSTPHAYITERRMQRARSLLCTTDRPIADIAAHCGFAHQSHLGAVLKERLGMSPRQYRRQAGRNLRTPPSSA